MGVMTAFAAAVFIAGPIAVILIVFFCVWKFKSRQAQANVTPPIIEVKREEVITIQGKLDDVRQDTTRDPMKYPDSTEPFESGQNESGAEVCGQYFRIVKATTLIFNAGYRADWCGKFQNVRPKSRAANRMLTHLIHLMSGLIIHIPYYYFLLYPQLSNQSRRPQYIGAEIVFDRKFIRSTEDSKRIPMC